MLIQKNPFTLRTFTETWFSKFHPQKKRLCPSTFKNLCFYRPGRLPLYINSGKNLTKGITYSIKDKIDLETKKKVLLIYDVPDFVEQSNPEKIATLKCKTARQYPGFLIDLTKFNNFEDYFSKNFSKKSRYKFRKYKKRLEGCFDISYRMYFGEIERDEYDEIFGKFRELLVKRFQDKQIFNNNLKDKEWSFYEEVAYPMILKKEASLFVIYENNKPIAITLLYFLDKVMIDAITVFDIDFSKFHLGSVMVMKLLEWSFANNIDVLDFSKGEFEYKKHWMTQQYSFDYHIWYDSKYLPTALLANLLVGFFNFKQYVRNKNFNELLHKLLYKIRYSDNKRKERLHQYEINTSDRILDITKLNEIGLKQSENPYLRKTVFDVLYLNQVHLKDVKIYGLGNTKEYLVQSQESAWKISFS